MDEAEVSSRDQESGEFELLTLVRRIREHRPEVYKLLLDLLIALNSSEFYGSRAMNNEK